jgi:hypothetical protein
MKRVIGFISLLLIAFWITATLAEDKSASASDPSLGTWVLNVSRSKFASLPPKTFVERYELRPDGYFVSTRSIVTKDGNPAFQQVIFKYDGKDYELFDNSSLAEFMASGTRAPLMLSAKVIDAYTIEYYVKQAGEIVGTGVRTVSRDGKTMTFSSKDAIAVLDKQ